MGGFAGHMSHLYENPGLTFKQVKDIFSKASNGELEGTEKTDGQNLFVSYSVKTGRAKAARNKGHIVTGGLNAEQLAEKFMEHANPNIKKVFVEAFDTFEKAVQSLDPEVQINIFGSDADVFYNAEVQDPRTMNVIKYDTKTLNIHQVGHVRYDKETKQIKQTGLTQYARTLDAALSTMQKAIQDKEYNVQKNAVRTLRALDDDIALNTAIERLDNELRKAGVSDNQTISDYLVARLVPYIDQQVELPEQNKELLLKRLFKIKGVTFNHVAKGLEPDQKEIIRAIIKNQGNVMKSMIFPIEDIVHDFSVAMLKGLESFFVLDNAKEVMRLRSEVSKARSAIEGSGDEEAIRILSQQMRKLKNVEDISTAIEGFVFDYDGHTYKFTGNFAPVNQILGLFKYGRGETPPIQFLGEQEGNLEGSDTELCERLVAVVPGAFKPPHRGHYNMVKHYSDIVGTHGEVVILVSPLAASERSGFDFTTQADVNTQQSIQIWDLFTKNLPNVVVRRSILRSPVRTAIEYTGPDGPMKAGDCAIPGASTKDGDETRFNTFAKNVEKYAKPGIKVIHPLEYAFTPIEDMHASDVRRAIKDGDEDTVLAHMPEHVLAEKDKILSILGLQADLGAEMLEETKKKGEDFIPPILYRLVEEVMDEQTEPIQRVYRATHKRNKLTTKGKKKKSTPFIVDPPEERGESSPPIGEENELEETSSMAAGDIQGAAIGRGRKKPVSPFEDLDVEKENEEERKRSHTVKGKSLATEQTKFIEEIVDYLLSNQEQHHAS